MKNCANCKYWSYKDYNFVHKKEQWQNVRGICWNDKNKTTYVDTSFDFLCQFYKKSLKLKFVQLYYKFTRPIRKYYYLYKIKKKNF